jgi:hypothetical protein
VNQRLVRRQSFTHKAVELALLFAAFAFMGAVSWIFVEELPRNYRPAKIQDRLTTPPSESPLNQPYPITENTIPEIIKQAFEDLAPDVAEVTPDPEDAIDPYTDHDGGPGGNGLVPAAPPATSSQPDPVDAGRGVTRGDRGVRDRPRALVHVKARHHPKKRHHAKAAEESEFPPWMNPGTFN